MKIAVLSGGRSTERNVSLSSGAKITNALRNKGHKAMMIDLFLGYDFKPHEQISDVFESSNTSDNYEVNSDVLTVKDIDKLRKDDTKGLFGKNVLSILQAADIVYLALHGGDGENGKVQAVLDLNGIRYTGSGALASGIAMDKAISKEMMFFNDIKTARFAVIHRGDDLDNLKLDFKFPMVAKPNNGGSSIGTTIIKNEIDLLEALKIALRFDNEIILEEFIEGREFSLGVINGEPLSAIEIIVNNGWYDYKNKFQNNSEAKFISPPDIEENIHFKMKKIALKVMKILNMENYGRIDFLVRKNDVFVIEANNLPGMTPLSLLPQEAIADGISYEDLCEQIILGKLKIYDRKE